MTAVPRVSVITPCFNGADFVAATIESVLAQTYPSVEHVVIDDGSTDGSWEVIRAFGDRIVAMRHGNQGLPRSRNLGVGAASGEMLLFLDADDLIAPDTVASLVEALEAPGEAVAACPWRDLVRRDGRWEGVESGVPFPQTGPDPLACWLEGEWIPGHALLWPRSLFERLGGYDESLTANEDGDLAFRAFLSGAPLRIARGGEALYRRHGTAAVSMSHDVFSEHRFRSRMRSLEKLEAAARERGLWDRYRPSVGVAYQRLAERVYGAEPSWGREALERGRGFAGTRAVAATLPGRILVRLLGMERKERVVRSLARLGLMTPGRRTLLERNRARRRSAGEER